MGILPRSLFRISDLSGIFHREDPGAFTEGADKQSPDLADPSAAEQKAVRIGLSDNEFSL